MSKLLRIFFTGLFISFLGSLPLGSLNIAAMQIGITDGIRPALLFALGSLLAEVVYVRLSLIAMDWIRNHQKLFRVLEWFTLAIVSALAISSFYAAAHPTISKNVILSSTLHRFVLGLTMSALNPMQIPFWFGWSTVLLTKKILLPNTAHYNIYILGIGLGTLFGNCVFIFGGRLIADRLNNNQHVLNWVIGGIFAVTAIIQLWKMFNKKDVSHRIEHPEEETTPFDEGVGEFNRTPAE
ncbi:MAG TPA: LysE family transporter [Chitinophagaceae bacterium]|nr:LysE family transporter [Chitinophagaceae bacterium]